MTAEELREIAALIGDYRFVQAAAVSVLHLNGKAYVESKQRITRAHELQKLVEAEAEKIHADKALWFRSF